MWAFAKAGASGVRRTSGGADAAVKNSESFAGNPGVRQA